MLDNAIDCSRFPIEAQKAEAWAKRRIGLGVTGLADALIMCRTRYGSAAGNSLVERWMGALRRASYLASGELAQEKGAFPLYDVGRYGGSPMVRALEDDVRAAISASGIRNALLTSVAPTGTISLLAGNISSGIEPVFSYSYTRNVLMPDGTRRAEAVEDHAYLLYRRLKGDAAPLPDYFVDAQSLGPEDHLAVQARVQAFVDASISKTINCPEEMAFEDFREIYTRAYELGCKGCTTYRPNEVTGAVLESAGAGQAGVGGAGKERSGENVGERLPAVRQNELPLDKPPARPEDEFEAGAVVHLTRALERPEALQGSTYKIRWPGSEHAIVHHDQRHRARRPAAAVRDFHQYQEPGASGLDAGAYADDERGVPEGRGRVVHRRGVEGGVRPDGRPVVRGQVRTVHSGADRHGHRGTSVGDRRCRGERREGVAGWRWRRWGRIGRKAEALPALRSAGSGLQEMTRRDGGRSCLLWCGWSRR